MKILNFSITALILLVGLVNPTSGHAGFLLGYMLGSSGSQHEPTTPPQTFTTTAGEDMIDCELSSSELLTLCAVHNVVINGLEGRYRVYVTPEQLISYTTHAPMRTIIITSKTTVRGSRTLKINYKLQGAHHD